MRILITASTLPRWKGDAIPSFVLDQSVALLDVCQGIEIEILAPHDAGAKQEEIINGVKIRRFKYCWPESFQSLAYPAILPNIRRKPWLIVQVPLFVVAELVAIVIQAKRFRPNVIYSHWFTPQALAGIVAAKIFNIPHVFTSHSSDVKVLKNLPLIGPFIVRLITKKAWLAL